MGLVKTMLHAKSIDVKPRPMRQDIDHKKLSSWLSDVAEHRDKQSFTELFKFFAPKIKHIATSRFPNDTQANEVVQETMSNVWRKAHLFDDSKGAATTWVYTVMRNVTFDMLRKVQGNKEDNLSDDIWPLAEGMQQESQVFTDHLEQKQLLTVIETLPESQRQVVKGFYFMEMSQEQLAVHLDLPLGTVKSRLRLALAKLKAQLGVQDD